MKNEYSIQGIRKLLSNLRSKSALILVDFKKGHPLEVIALEKTPEGEIINGEEMFKALKKANCHPRIIKLQTVFYEMELPENVVQFKVA